MRKNYLVLSLLFLPICFSVVNGQTYIPNFSHTFHADSADTECKDCHPNADSSKKAEDKNLPVRHECDACHFEEIHYPPLGIGKCNMCHPDTNNIEPFPNPDRNLIFSHVYHITEQNQQCLDCHEDNKLPDKNINCAECHDVTSSDSCLRCHITKPTSVNNFQDFVIPKVFNLEQNYPNPFNPITRIRYQLPKCVHIRIEIYNIQGIRVRTLIDAIKYAGYYEVEWDGRNESGSKISSGVYIYSITAGRFSKSRKMVLIR